MCLCLCVFVDVLVCLCVFVCDFVCVMLYGLRFVVRYGRVFVCALCLLCLCILVGFCRVVLYVFVVGAFVVCVCWSVRCLICECFVWGCVV